MTFNMLSKFSMKSLIFIISALTVVDSCIHICHAIQYASLDEAYAPHTTLHEVADAPEEREVKLDHALKGLSEVQRIYRFDCNILTSDGLTPPHALDFTSVDLHMALSLMTFYSQDRNERDYAFAQQIKQPLLSVLHNAAEASFKFPSTLRYLEDPRVTGCFQELLDIALRDLFFDPVEGLPALSTALNGLKTNKKLTREEERKLRLFKNLAGFFYDLKTLQHLRKKMKRF